jgi:NADPH:quinone reductase-like Zn-dependent oxidoreductase
MGVLAAAVREFGQPPILTTVSPDISDRQRRLRVLVASVALNPVDQLITSGRWYGGNPALPHIPGREGVGVVDQDDDALHGDLVYFRIRGTDPGALSREAYPLRQDVIRLPMDVDPLLAAGVGFAGATAGIALKIRGELAPRESVCVLGATGSVGRMAVVLAEHFGASQVIAVGRRTVDFTTTSATPNTRYLALEEHLQEGQSAEEQVATVAAAMKELVTGPLDLVLDPVWGVPAAAAMRCLGHRGRLVNLGSSAGTHINLPSELIRSTSMEIRGHSTASASPELFAEFYRQAVALARTVDLPFPMEVFSLAEAERAWHRVKESPSVKVVFDLRKEDW